MQEGIMDGYVGKQEPKPIWDALIFPEEHDPTVQPPSGTGF